MILAEAEFYELFDTLTEAEKAQSDYFNKWIIEQRKKVPNDNAVRWAYVEKLEINGQMKYGYPKPPKLND